MEIHQLSALAASVRSTRAAFAWQRRSAEIDAGSEVGGKWTEGVGAETKKNIWLDLSVDESVLETNTFLMLI